MRDFAKQFYSSKAWKECREAYKKSVGYQCERCKAKGLLSPAEVVHHKIHINRHNIKNPEIVLSFDNLEALCRKCHGEEHKTVKKRYFVDKCGRVGAVKDAE